MRHILGSIFVLLIYLFSLSTKADNSLQLSAGFSFWNSNPDGSLGQPTNTVLALDKDTDTQSSYYFRVEHYLPYTPHLKVVNTSTSNQATPTLDQTFVFDNTVFRVASTLNIESTYKQLDAIAYYELLDIRTFEIDLGVTFRRHSIHNHVTSQDDSSDTTLSKVSDIQLLGFAAGKVNLPLLNLEGFIETSILNSDTYDIQAGVNYNVLNSELMKTYLQLGVKKQNLKFTDLDGIYTELNWQSWFIGMDFRF